MVVQELYHAQFLAADSVTPLEGTGFGGFIAQTAGTITVTSKSGNTIFLNAFPVTAGSVYSFRVYTGTSGYVVTLASGASGTILKA